MRIGFLYDGKKMYFLYCFSLVEDYGDNKRWIFFCEDEIIINLLGFV